MYSTELWNEWLEQESSNYQLGEDGKKIYHKKGYLHLDNRFWFPERYPEIQQILQNGLKELHPHTGNLQFRSFYPFLKILLKTPRYRYQFEEGEYELETKIRPICFAAHIDSLLMGFYSFGLTKKYEEYIRHHQFSDVVLAYRSDLKKSNIQFAKEVFDQIKKRGCCSAIALDIKGYFDHIDHTILLEKWQKILGKRLDPDQFKLFNILTDYSYISQKSILKKYTGKRTRHKKLPHTLFDVVPGKGIREKFIQLKKDSLIVENDHINKLSERKCGIPQGSAISALLSNIFLLDFDSELKQKSIDEKFVYRRYCDDILLICNTEDASGLMKYVIEKISNEYFLEIQPSKVDLIDFQKNASGKIRGFKRPRRTRVRVGEKDVVKILDEPAKITKENQEKFYKPLQYLGFEYNGKDILLRSSSLSRFFWKLNYRLQRTVIMAHSPKSKDDQIFLKQIYERYTHLGKRNFVSYAYKAASKNYTNKEGKLLEGMNSPAIKRQLKNHFNILRSELAKKNDLWFSHKSKGKKVVQKRYFK